MYKLFWKIFFSFWLTILFIELLTAWVTAGVTEAELHPILEQENLSFVANSTEAVYVLTAEGLDSLKRWMSTKDNLTGIDKLYVIDQERKEVNNKPLPPNIRAILDRDFSETPIDHYQPIKHTLTFPTVTQNGDSYLIISTFAHPHLLRYLFAPERVTLAVLISGIICFLLARYFTSPLTSLRRSTQKLTKGEFDTTNLNNLRNRNDEFGALAIDFDNMSQRLQHLLDTQRQLLRDISHELNSPLARIRVATELARNKFISGKSDEFDRIEKEIERLEFLIRELLTFVKIEASESLSNITKVDMHEMLSYIVDDAQFLRKHSPDNQKITLNCPAAVMVDGDAVLLHRAIDNIVRNASYYSPKDSTITIHCNQQVNNVRIAVEDQGPGVPPDMLGKIFQPFVRVSSAREHDTGGSGIGLAIARRVITLHGGTISAGNKSDNSGLVITISLPMHHSNLRNPVSYQSPLSVSE